MPYGPRLSRQAWRGLPIAPTLWAPATRRSNSAPSDHSETGHVPGAGRAATAPTTSQPSRSSSGANAASPVQRTRSEEHTSELQSHSDLVCRLLLEKKKKKKNKQI